jgi:hypothetical protein
MGQASIIIGNAGITPATLTLQVGPVGAMGFTSLGTWFFGQVRMK